MSKNLRNRVVNPIDEDAQVERAIAASIKEAEMKKHDKKTPKAEPVDNLDWNDQPEGMPALKKPELKRQVAHVQDPTKKIFSDADTIEDFSDASRFLIQVRDVMRVCDGYFQYLVKQSQEVPDLADHKIASYWRNFQHWEAHYVKNVLIRLFGQWDTSDAGVKTQRLEYQFDTATLIDMCLESPNFLKLLMKYNFGVKDYYMMWCTPGCYYTTPINEALSRLAFLKKLSAEGRPVFENGKLAANYRQPYKKPAEKGEQGEKRKIENYFNSEKKSKINHPVEVEDLTHE